MKIEGYTEHDGDDPNYTIQVFLSDDVCSYFSTEGQKGRRNARDVRKSKFTLTQLKRFGLARVQHSTNFKREGKFASGRKSGGDQVVYEVKSDQVRVYGGEIKYKTEAIFLFVEATTKKKDKADMQQLKRVAKTLGAIQDELGKRK